MKIWVMVLAVLAIGVVGCKKNATTDEGTVTDADEDELQYMVEAAINDAGGNANSMDGSSPQPMSAHPMAACSYSSARSACSSLTATVDWNGCTISTGESSSSITVSGIIGETYSGFGAAVCQLNGNNSSVTRIISNSSPKTITGPKGGTITTDMVQQTAFNGDTLPTAANGTVITRLETGTSNALTCSLGSPCYNIVLNGVHSVFRGPLGRKWYEYTIIGNVTAQGTKAAGTRVLSGSMTTYHQIRGIKAVSTFSNVTWGSSSCCYPTAGSVSTTVSGDISGTIGLAFTSTCGSATFTDASGASATRTLRNCSP